MRDREGAYLRNDGSPLRRQQKDADDEEHVIEAVRQDVREPEDEVLPSDLGARRRRQRRCERHRRAGRPAHDPLCLHRTVADPDVQRVGAEREAVGEADVRSPAGNRTAEPDLRWGLREIVEGGGRQVFERGGDGPAVERDAGPFEKHAGERRDPPVSRVTRQVARDRLLTVRFERRQQRIRIDDDIDFVGAVVERCLDLCFADFVRGGGERAQQRETEGTDGDARPNASRSTGLNAERSGRRRHRAAAWPAATSMALAWARMSASFVPVRSACAIAPRAADMRPALK